MKKISRFLTYVVLYHVARILLEVLLPNAHIFNLARGKVIGLFFKRVGKRFALASGCIINCPWNIEVGNDVYIAHNCWVNASGGLVINDGVVLSPGVVIATTAHARVNGKVSLRSSKLAPVILHEGSWIASNSVVTRGVTVGKGVVVSANSVVISNLDDNALYGGNPARHIKQLNVT